jgi:hypothetical protein
MKEEETLNKLQKIILDRIHERKRKIHKLHSIVYNDNLWLQIQTLEWVLSEIRSKKNVISICCLDELAAARLTAKINSLMLLDWL